MPRNSARSKSRKAKAEKGRTTSIQAQAYKNRLEKEAGDIIRNYTESDAIAAVKIWQNQAAQERDY